MNQDYIYLNCLVNDATANDDADFTNVNVNNGKNANANNGKNVNAIVMC